jgi:hypothetical protein
MLFSQVLREAFEAAVVKRMMSDVPFGERNTAFVAALGVAVAIATSFTYPAALKPCHTPALQTCMPSASNAAPW